MPTETQLNTIQLLFAIFESSELVGLNCELYQIKIICHWMSLFFNHILSVKSNSLSQLLLATFKSSAIVYWVLQGILLYQFTKYTLRVLILLYLSATSWHPWFPASKWVVLAPAEQMPCCRDRWCLQSRQMYCQLLSGFSYIFFNLKLGRTFSFLLQVWMGQLPSWIIIENYKRDWSRGKVIS